MKDNCTHENLDSYEDGNAGGFAKFAYVCADCGHELSYDELESR